MRTPAVIAVAAVLTGCGASSSPEDQVKDVVRNGIQAIADGEPERACRYMLDRDACITSAITAKALDVDVASVLGIPDDWASQLAAATVTIKGDSATLAGFDTNGDGKPGRYVRKDGKWLVDNRS